MNAQLLNASRRAMVSAARPVGRRYATTFHSSNKRTAPADYGRLVRQVGGTFMLFVPASAAVLFWPLAAPYVVPL